ncbi:MAG: sugar phosphate isomerase/epimerase [Methylacidiphilales bacterium]|nr:sugar phosphate isomerase/epimerase [Candidatus Methylacidiphilales bacterium]
MKPINLSREKIRIGTLVGAKTVKGMTAAKYISQILPHGFESFSLTFWQNIGDTDLKQLAGEVKRALGDSGVTISSLGIYGNPLETQPIDRETADGFKKLIDHAHLFGAGSIVGFAGRVRGKSIPESIPRFKKIFSPLAKRAADRGLRLAFENCSMGGNWQSGDWNIAHNPSAWRLMFDAVPDANVGLEWEPCHQMVELIDPLPQLREWTPKIFHVHGKDATIHWDTIRRHGIGGVKPYVFHRTPGFGDSNWTEIISELRRHGFTGSIDIEGWHDPVYRDELEMTGQVHGLNYLKQCRGGSFIPNPAL